MVKVIAQRLLFVILALMIAAPAVFATSKKDTEGSTNNDTLKVDPSKIVENLIFDWPKGEKWNAGYNVSGEKGNMQLYFPEGQSSSGWDEMVTVETSIGKKQFVVGLARTIYLGTQRGSPNATWDIIEKGLTKRGRQFVIFEIDCPDFLSGEPPQVQLWTMIMGDTGIFTLQYSYHAKEMPEKRKTQILDMMKNAYIEAKDKE